MDIVNFISGNGAENGSQGADNPCLLAMVYMVVPDNVAANRFPGLAIFKGPVNGAYIALRCSGLVVIFIAIFAEGYPGTD